MTRRSILLLAISILLHSNAFGQTDKIKGAISTSDTADLSILNIYPEAFPNVSVVFKAQTRKGEPVWNLTREKMQVQENSQHCSVISLERISQKTPINLSMVIDHSGSMIMDMAQLHHLGHEYIDYDSSHNPVFPAGYKPPLENAKSAVKAFASSFNYKKDFISITGFSDLVDVRLELTQDSSKINAIINEIQVAQSTALYDALITGIGQITQAKGMKVLVALTDGQDNASYYKWRDVVEKANKEKVPVYIIGLGDVSKDTLQMIARLTDGQFYFAESSTALSSIYALISKQVQAFYSLVYESPSFSIADSTRQLELTFDIDSLYLVSNPATLHLPKEIAAYLEAKQKQQQYLLYGGIALAILLAAGTLLFYFNGKPKIKRPVIKRIFPNPASSFINLDAESAAGQLQIMTISGLLVKTIDIVDGETQFDVSDLSDGNYVAVIQAEGQNSTARKFIIQK